MNRYFKKKAVAAISLVLLLVSLCICNLATVSLSLDMENGIAEGITKLESSINEQFFGKFYFLDLYGAAQKLLMKNEMNDFEVPFFPKFGISYLLQFKALKSFPNISLIAFLIIILSIGLK